MLLVQTCERLIFLYDIPRCERLCLLSYPAILATYDVASVVDGRHLIHDSITICIPRPLTIDQDAAEFRRIKKDAFPWEACEVVTKFVRGLQLETCRGLWNPIRYQANVGIGSIATGNARKTWVAWGVLVYLTIYILCRSTGNRN